MKRFTVTLSGGDGEIAPWPAYRSGGQLIPAVAAKAMADAIYRHLLADVFRETAEWCGHTFSVGTSI